MDFIQIAELYITIKYRSNSILVIIRQIVADLWPLFDSVFVVSFKLCRALYQRKIQVKFDIGNQSLDELWSFFDLVFVGVLILVSDQ